jgi:arsenate reductase
MSAKPAVLVLCTGNSCRSQMAEGFLKALASDRFDVHSAGTEPKGEVHPVAVEVMREVGIDISAHRPKSIKQFLGHVPVRHLIIVCGGAEKQCPRTFIGVNERHFWPFDDPAEVTGSPAERLAGFRHVRDQIRARIDQWLVAAAVPAASGDRP